MHGAPKAPQIIFLLNEIWHFCLGWVFCFFLSSCMCSSEKLWSPSWTRETNMSVCKRRATHGDNLIVALWSWIHQNWYEKSFPFVFGQIGLKLRFFSIFFPRVLNKRDIDSELIDSKESTNLLIRVIWIWTDINWINSVNLEYLIHFAEKTVTFWRKRVIWVLNLWYIVLRTLFIFSFNFIGLQNWVCWV